MKKRLAFLTISILLVSLLLGFWYGFSRAKDQYRITDSSFYGWNVLDDQYTITDVSEPDEYGEIVISTVLKDTKMKYAFRIMPDTIYFEGGIPLGEITAGDVIRIFAAYSHMTVDREAICRYIEMLPAEHMQ